MSDVFTSRRKCRGTAWVRVWRHRYELVLWLAAVAVQAIVKGSSARPWVKYWSPSEGFSALARRNTGCSSQDIVLSRPLRGQVPAQPIQVYVRRFKTEPKVRFRCGRASLLTTCELTDHVFGDTAFTEDGGAFLGHDLTSIPIFAVFTVALGVF